jgi:hypothetical protein
LQYKLYTETNPHNLLNAAPALVYYIRYMGLFRMAMMHTKLIGIWDEVENEAYAMKCAKT